MTIEKPELFKLADGRVLAYNIHGLKDAKPGDTVVYFHGFMSGRFEGAIIADRCEALGLKLITADRSGYGLSTFDPERDPVRAVEDIRQLLDAILPGEQVIFYGVSGGAAYAAMCAALMPDRARGLVLLVPYFPIAGREDLAQKMSNKGRQIVTDIRHSPFKTKSLLYVGSLLQRTPFRRMVMRVGGFAPVDIETSKKYKERSKMLNLAGRDGNKHGLLGHYRDLEVMSMIEYPVEHLEAVKCPAVIWCGALDQTTPPAMAEAFAEALPDVKLKVVEDMGHFVGMKYTKEVIESILERLGALQNAGRSGI